MTDKTSILLFLRYLNALDRRRSVKVEDLAKFLAQDLSDINSTVLTLSEEGKIFLDKGRIWLTPLGFSVSLRDYS
ncbi:MAG: hypothetical protein ACUVQ8_00425 [Nitrososphaeria archaeon]